MKRPTDNPASGQVGPKRKGGGKLRQESRQARPSERLRHEDEAPPANGGASPHDKKSARDGKRLDKSKLRAEKSGERLDAAREKLAAQKPPQKPGLVKSVAKKAAAGAWHYGHQKIREVERENVGVEATHQTELAGESVIRGGARFIQRRIRTRPARRVAKREKKNIEARADYQLRQAERDNPELKRNALSRYAQKQKIKRQYQKQAREAAKQSAKAAKKTAVTTEKLARAVWGYAKKHPVAALIVLGAFLLVFAAHSCVSSAGSVGNGILGAVGGTSYVSSDSDIEAVEAEYMRLEADLRARLSRIESDYPGYDEYRYTVDEIGHDPYELASYLTTKYADYTPTTVRAELRTLLEKQYTVTIEEITEVRYRTETREGTYTTTDPVTGEVTTHTYTYEVEVPYDYHILSVTLKNNALSTVIAASLDAVQTERYAVYQRLRGNRPYLFAGNIYAHAGEYTDYEIPPEALADPAFAALIAEAEKYLGYPYVWGGSRPSTSFDCSGFVCWILNQSGVASVGRTNAQGLFNRSTPISPSEARPGDLIFFTGSRAAQAGHPVTHVGLYVGGGMMIHCAGNGVEYHIISSPYYSANFYAFGRLAYN